jgi:hypothetical protein
MWQDWAWELAMILVLLSLPISATNVALSFATGLNRLEKRARVAKKRSRYIDVAVLYGVALSAFYFAFNDRLSTEGSDHLWLVITVGSVTAAVSLQLVRLAAKRTPWVHYRNPGYLATSYVITALGAFFIVSLLLPQPQRAVDAVVLNVGDNEELEIGLKAITQQKWTLGAERSITTCVYVARNPFFGSRQMTYQTLMDSLGAYPYSNDYRRAIPRETYVVPRLVARGFDVDVINDSPLAVSSTFLKSYAPKTKPTEQDILEKTLQINVGAVDAPELACYGDLPNPHGLHSLRGSNPLRDRLAVVMQKVTVVSSAAWRWSATSRESGARTIFLVLYRVSDPKDVGHPDRQTYVATLEVPIKVQGTLLDGDQLSKWLGILTTIVTVAAFLYRALRDRGKSPIIVE